MLRVNVVTGDRPVDWVFADLLDRLYSELPHDEVVTFETPEPMEARCQIDVHHYYRPEAAIPVEDLSRSVITCHGFGKRWKQGVVQPLYGDDVMAVFRRAGTTLVLNSLDEDLIKRSGRVHGQIFRVPHPVDPDVFTLRAEHDPNGKLVIGRVGRPYGPPDSEDTGEENKGRATLRAIMRELRPEAERIKWLFLGDGWEMEESLAQGWGYEVEFVRRSEVMYPEDFVAAYHQMDVYLVTSRSEGGPASLPEAMACGVWPLCTPVGMCVDMIGPPVGELYPINGHAIAAGRIRMHLNGRTKLSLLREAVRTRAVGWTWHDWARAHFEAYQRIASV